MYLNAQYVDLTEDVIVSLRSIKQERILNIKMSADNLIRIMKKPNGHYQVRHESASSLAHALKGVKPTEDELLIEIVADDIEDFWEARKKAEKFIEEYESDGGIVEYGIVSDIWKK